MPCSVVALLCLAGVSLATHSLPEHQLRAREVQLAANNSTLQYVQIVWRHGDRTPSTVFPLEEEKNWKEGLGELTSKGIAQQYKLGQWLRERYGSWLGSTFDRNEVYIRSSDYNRTLMSAMANMAGLFPPQKSEQWDENLLWQPVPVHSISRQMDKELYELIACPPAVEDRVKVWQSAKALEMERKNKALLDYIGHNINDPDFRLKKMWTVFDMLNCQYLHNDTHTWPSWVNASIFAQITELYDLSSQLEFHTDVQRRLRGGPLLVDMMARFAAKHDGLLGERPKLYAYSAHDTTIAALLATIGVFPDVFPLYATAVLIEMHLVDGEQIIEVHHKNGTDSEKLFVYEIPGCPAPCSLNRMRKALDRFLPSDWEGECGMRPLDQTSMYLFTIGVLSFTTLLFGSVLALDIVLKRRRRASEANGRVPLMHEEGEAAD